MRTIGYGVLAVIALGLVFVPMNAPIGFGPLLLPGMPSPNQGVPPLTLVGAVLLAIVFYGLLSAAARRNRGNLRGGHDE